MKTQNMKFISLLFTIVFSFGNSKLLASDVLVNDSDDFWTDQQYYVNVVLSNRDLISKEIILFPNPKNKIDQTLDTHFKVLIRPSKDANNLTLVYSSKKGEKELYTEDVGRANDFRIREIILLYNQSPKFMIVNISVLSQGATGDGSAHKELLIFSLSEQEISRFHRPIKIEETWWTPYGSLEYKVDLTRLPKSSKYLLVLDSYEERITYVLDGTNEKISINEEYLPRKIKPSFKCSRKNTNIEKLICADDGLSSLDSLLSRIYERISKTESIRMTQRVWLKDRNSCESTSDFLTNKCLTALYDSRIEFLFSHLNSK